MKLRHTFTRISKACACALLPLFLTTVGASAQDAAAQDPARLAAARDVLEVTGAKRQMSAMSKMMEEGFKKGAAEGGNASGGKEAEQFQIFLKKFEAKQDKMLEEMASLYASKFTAEEMKAIADFYRSGPGAKFIVLMPELVQAGGQIGMKHSLEVMKEMKAEGNAPPQ